MENKSKNKASRPYIISKDGKLVDEAPTEIYSNKEFMSESEKALVEKLQAVGIKDILVTDGQNAKVY